MLPGRHLEATWQLFCHHFEATLQPFLCLSLHEIQMKENAISVTGDTSKLKFSSHITLAASPCQTLSDACVWASGKWKSEIESWNGKRKRKWFSLLDIILCLNATVQLQQPITIAY